MALATPVMPRTAPAFPVHTSLQRWLDRFETVHVDLGTGDGAFALRVAREYPTCAVIGIDTNQDGLRGSPRRYPPNVRFERLDALAWPAGSLPMADAVTVNFPYGSLLRGLTEGHAGFLERLDALLGPGSRIAVRVNASAFSATGLDPASGPARIVAALRQVPGLSIASRPLAQDELRAFPSSWSKRLGYGRDTVATRIDAVRSNR